MKLKHLFATLSLAIVAGAGVAAGVSGGNAQKAEATISGGTYLYLKVDQGKWNKAGARFAFAYITTDDSATYWADMVPYDSSLSIYEGFLPAGTWGKLIFCRMDPATSTNNWNNKWNQSSDLTSIDGDYYLVYDNGGEPTDKNGAWQNPYYGSRNYTWTMVTSTDGFKTSERMTVPYKGDGSGQAYISLSLDAGTEFYFERNDATTATDRDWDDRDTQDTSMAGGAVVASTDSSGNFRAAKKSALEIYVKPNGKVWIQNDSTADAKSFASSFVESIEGNCPYNYSTESYSGKTVSNLVSAWNAQGEAYSHLTDGAKSVLQSATTSSEGSLKDFARVYDYVLGKYESTLTQSGNAGNFANRTVVPVAGAINPISTSVESSYTSIIAIIGAVSLVAIGGFFFIRRKRA